jgi:hypothetical protein
MKEKARTVQMASKDGDWSRPKRYLRMREKIEQIGWDWPKMRQKCGDGWDWPKRKQKCGDADCNW